MMERSFFMAQITDIGGQDYGNKIKMETEAANSGVSLGLQPTDEPQPAPPPRSLPNTGPEPNLNLGPASDFILNGPDKGNNPLDGLGFNAGIPLSEEGLNYKTEINKAVDLMNNSSIPMVRKAAAEFIKQAAYSRTIQRVRAE